mmetsp:Transcript_2695/g.3994  ORF Transcript_2695/g.3994 Transcript_2695/m.3994 type:complete len:105 (+) Transcript_2695:442-756(+)
MAPETARSSHPESNTEPQSQTCLFCAQTLKDEMVLHTIPKSSSQPGTMIYDFISTEENDNLSAGRHSINLELVDCNNCKLGNFSRMNFRMELDGQHAGDVILSI